MLISMYITNDHRPESLRVEADMPRYVYGTSCRVTACRVTFMVCYAALRHAALRLWYVMPRYVYGTSYRVTHVTIK